MLGECHAHVIMDGQNYRKAVELHTQGVREEVIHQCFRQYCQRGISFVRDGGDSYGVSARAKELAPAYGIDYRTPVFAIHKEGHYGAIVGKSFRDIKEYHSRVQEAKNYGADFIKIMTTGLMDFNNNGAVTGIPLDAGEVKEMVHIAHEEGMAVMSHTNGVYGVQAAIEAGTDSIEHGNFIDKDTVKMLADSGSVWVPTMVTVRNLLGCGRFEDSVIRRIMEETEETIRYAFEIGAKVALGSDAGAYQVPHGQGTVDEYQAFLEILGGKTGENEREAAIRTWLEYGESIIREKFV